MKRGRGRPKGSGVRSGLPQLRNSERGAFKRCQFLWHLTFQKELRPITAAPALRFGTLVHAALAKYYKVGRERGPRPHVTFERLYNKELKEQTRYGFRDEDGTWEEAGELGVLMLENYLEHYGTDDEWEVLATEQPFRVTVYHPDSYDPNHPPEAQATAKPWFEMVGIVDGVWRHRPTRKVWIPDHKTTSGIGGTTQHPEVPKWLLMDDQAGTYWSFGVLGLIAQGILKKDVKISGMLFNFLRKAKPDERPYKIVNKQKLHLNKDGTISKRQPPPYFYRQPIYRDEYDRQMSMQRTLDDFAAIEAARKGAPILKSPGMFTCPMCPVRDVCELHETGSDWESMLQMTTQQWDPYADHEIREGR